MDLNGDGCVDILSGSYSRQDKDMAGLFQVLWGREGGGFAKAETLMGTDGEPLIIPGGEEDVTSRICTRPTAVDIDADGKLDVVSGNFTGTFYLFPGEGEGRFQPTGEFLSRLRVSGHGDPFFVDWDGDGDLDMLSGSDQGGVFLFVNEGSKREASFEKSIELLKPVGHHTGETRFGDDFLTGPQSDTRVWADDLNGDGRLDLLVGDNVTLLYPAEGVDDATAQKALDEHSAAQQELFRSYPAMNEDEEPTEDQQRALAAWTKEYEALKAERDKVVREDRTGFVWVLYRR